MIPEPKKECIASIAMYREMVNEGAIAYNSMKVTTTLTNSYGVNAGVTIKQPEWAGSVGGIGESVLPAVADTIKELSGRQKNK